MPAESALAGLRQFAARRATQLIVGKSRRSRWFELRHGSIVDRLVRDAPGLAVHVLPLSEAGGANGASSRLGEGWGSWHGYAVSLGLGAAITVLGRMIFAQGSITNIGLLSCCP
jgi:two-component system sensor histidine kinase KdpD